MSLVLVDVPWHGAMVRAQVRGQRWTCENEDVRRLLEREAGYGTDRDINEESAPTPDLSLAFRAVARLGAQVVRWEDAPKPPKGGAL